MIPPGSRGGPAGPPGDKTLPLPDPATAQVIRGYGPGRFLIGDSEWRQPVLVTPGATTAWNVTRADELSVDILPALTGSTAPCELLVVGCGPRSLFIAPDKRAAFKAAGIALEVVETGAGCRIYNVLLSEGRRVAAALIPL